MRNNHNNFVLLYTFALQYIGATHNYKNSRQAKLAIYELGEDIKAGKLPAHFGPLTFVFTGSGNVSQVMKASVDNLLLSNGSLFYGINLKWLDDNHGVMINLMFCINIHNL